MAGLLDGIDPQTALLLGLGSGLLGTSGNGRRASFGEALANGMQQGTQGYRQAIGDRQRAQQLAAEQAARAAQQQLAQKQFAMTEKEFAYKEADRARSIEQMQRMQTELMNIDPTGRLFALYKLDPKAAAEQVFPKGIGVKDVDARELTPDALAAFRQSGRLTPGALAFKPQIDIVNGVAIDKSAMVPGQVAPQPVSDPIIRGADGRPQVNELAARAKNPSDPFYLSGNGTIAPNQTVQDFLMRKAAAGATRVSTSVNTEKTYAGNIAEGLAKHDITAIDAARGANSQIETSQRIKQLVGSGQVTTGTFASQRQALDKALATAGLVDGSRVVNTEALVSELSGQTLDSIKSSGLGSGAGFTDKDRAFLQEARSGNIEMTPQNIYRIADLNERVGRAAVKRGSEVAGRLKGNPTMGGVGQALAFDEPPPVKALPLPPGKPTAGNLLTGATYEIPGKGVYRWDGFNFNKEN